MGIPWDAIPESRGSIPGGLYTFAIDAVEEQTSRNGTKMYKETKHVAEGQHRGFVAYEYHNIGTPADPMAKDPKTWAESIGARTLKGLFKAIDVPFSDNVTAMCEQARGRLFQQEVREKVEPATRLDRSTGKEVPNVFTTPDGREVSREGQRTNDFGRRFRAPAQAPASPPGAPAGAGGGEATIKSPFTGEMIPQSRYAEHIDAQLRK